MTEAIFNYIVKLIKTIKEMGLRIMSHRDKEKYVNNLTEDSQITKSKMLIFAQTTPSNLPVSAQRLFLALLSSINKDEEGNTFIIRGKDIATLADLPANVVGQQLQEMSISADSLRKYTLVINEDDGNALRVGLISSTKYLKGERAIRVSVDPYLMPYLRKMKEQFVISYTAGGPMKFRSEYSICLYDMMNYYLDQGGHYFTLAEVREMYNIPDGKIVKTSILNQKVIAPSLRDINTYTNLEVTMKYEKQGRTIIGYYFFVKRKDGYNAPQITLEENTDEKFIMNLTSAPYNFNKYYLVKLIDKYGINSIRNNFEYTKKQSPRNFSRYLSWAIQNQIYEKERELEQIKAINIEYKSENQIPKYHDEESLFAEEELKNEPIDIDEEALKERNPYLYSLLQKVKNKQ